MQIQRVSKEKSTPQRFGWTFSMTQYPHIHGLLLKYFNGTNLFGTWKSLINPFLWLD